MSWYRHHREQSVRARPAVPAITNAWVRLSCKSILCFPFLCSDVPALEWRFRALNYFFYMLILYQMYWCDIVAGVCKPVFVCMLFYVFDFFFFPFLFLLILLMAHIIISLLAIVWEESALMPRHSILEDLTQRSPQVVRVKRVHVPSLLWSKP